MTTAMLFTRAAQAYMHVLGSIRDDQWELPALGAWNVRSLAGHTARAVLTVENYLNQDEPGEVTIASASHYYVSVFAQVTDPAAVEARGVEAGVWLGDHPVAQAFAALERTQALIDAQPDNRIVSIGGMGILLSEYLHTRVFELVVHTIDLARATGVEHTVPKEALNDALMLAAQIAAIRGSAEDALFALTGRGQLPESFSVVS